MSLLGCFTSRRGKKDKEMKISSPINLLLKGEVCDQRHKFRSKFFRRQYRCVVCGRLVGNYGSACRVCKYACHKGCESKAAADCKRCPSNHASRSESGVTPAITPSSPSKPLPEPRPLCCRNSGSSDQWRPLDGAMQLHFVAQRMMALYFPRHIGLAEYDDNLRQVALMLHSKHGQNCMVFNLSERMDDQPRLNGRGVASDGDSGRKLAWQVCEHGWPDSLAPPLDRLCSLCKNIDNWLARSSQHVVVLYARGVSSDRGGWEKIGLTVSAFIHYSNICRNPDQALDRLAMKKFFDDKIRHLETPSMKRYVNYFAGLLSGLISINSSALSLHHLVITSPTPGGRGGGGGVSAVNTARYYWIQVYQGLVPVWRSDVQLVQAHQQYLIISTDTPLSLLGDILITCHYSANSIATESYSSTIYTEESDNTVWRLQFHTCAVPADENQLMMTFSQHELDLACDDPDFPLDTRLELHFSSATLPRDMLCSSSPASRPQTNSFPVRSSDHQRSSSQQSSLGKQQQQQDHLDSYSSFCNGLRSPGDSSCHVQHTQGPLDGSLYATVMRRSSDHPACDVTDINSTCTGVDHTHVSSVTAPTAHTISMDSGIWSGGKESGSGRGGVGVTCGASSSSGTSSNHHSPGSAGLSADTGCASVSMSSGRHSMSTVADCENLSAAVPTPAARTSSVAGVAHDMSQLDAMLDGMLQYCADMPDLNPTPDVDAIRVPDFEVTPARLPVVSVGGATVAKASDDVTPVDAHLHWSRRVEAASSNQSQLDGDGEMVASTTVNKNQRSSVDRGGSAEDSAIPYHARINSKPFSYLNDGSRPSAYQMSVARTPSPQSRMLRVDSPDLDAPRVVDAAQQRQKQLQSPQLVRKLLGSGGREDLDSTKSGHVTWSSGGDQSVLGSSSSSVVRGKENHRPLTNGQYSIAASSARTGEVYNQLRVNGKSVTDSTPLNRSASFSQTDYSPRARYNNMTNSGAHRNGILKSPSVERGGGFTAGGSVGGGCVGYRTDTLRSTSSYNTDTMRSDRSSDWNSTLRSTSSIAPERVLPDPPPRSLSVDRCRRWTGTDSYRHQKTTGSTPTSRIPTNSSDMDFIDSGARVSSQMPTIDPSDPNAHSVTTYDQNSNAVTTVSTQSFDMPCSPNPVRKIVETTKRYTVDRDQDRADQREGVTKLEETIREFVIEDLPDGSCQIDGPATNGNLTWLQKQQQKLRQRQLARNGSHHQLDSGHESRRLRHTSLVDNDGYTSDATTVHWPADLTSSREASPAKCSTPLHVHTPPPPPSAVSEQLQQRSASMDRQYGNSAALHRYRSRYEDSDVMTPHRPVTRHSSESAYDRRQTRTYTSGDRSTPVHQRDNGLLTTVNGSSGEEDEIDAQINPNPERPNSPWKYRRYGVWLARVDENRVLSLPVNGSPLLKVRDPPEPRVQTPSFPDPPRTPYMNRTRTMSPNTRRKLLTVTQTKKTYTRSPSRGSDDCDSPMRVETKTSFEPYPSLDRRSRRSSSDSNSDIITAHPFFVKDSSKLWYQPKISRQQAVAMLLTKPVGSFVIRDSKSFPGAFGLAVRVSANNNSNSDRQASPAPSSDEESQLVRHFLLETTSKGVRVKGSRGEPTFGSLSALVYQHSVTPFSLPVTLRLPDPNCGVDSADASERNTTHSVTNTLQTGAACNVLFLFSMDTELLTGPQAVKRTVANMFRQQPPPEALVVHFKVSSTGITLTDNQRKVFFRRHYNGKLVSHCGMDPDERRWSIKTADGRPPQSYRLFGFVVKKAPPCGNNECHLFAEYESDQPASAIVNFVNEFLLCQTNSAAI